MMSMIIENWKRRKHRIITIVAVFVFIFIFSMGFRVYASEGEGVIYARITAPDSWNGTVVNIDGAEIGAVKIADYDSGTFVLKEDYRGADNLISDNLDDMLEASRKIAEVNDDYGYRVFTDSNGIGIINGLEDGAYLVTEVSKTGTAAKYTSFAPFVIRIPFDSNGIESREADISPKVSMITEKKPEDKTEENKKEEKHKNTKTSDHAEAVGILGGLIIVSVLVIYIINKEKRTD